MSPGRGAGRGRRTALRCGVSLLTLAIVYGCAATPSRDGEIEYGRLAKVGLRVISEDAAMIPAADSGRFLPCRVNRDFAYPPLEPHPAGYLIVGVGGRFVASRAEILQALAQWKAGETVQLKIQLNPYLRGRPESFTWDVPLRLPR